jgi:hypothetical protein
MRSGQLILVALLGWATAACGTGGPAPPAGEGDQSAKIRFDLSGLNQDGLYGPPDGLRALAYEFCIPARPELADEVRAIDPTVEIYPGSPGRIGCTRDQYLCIGSSHQPDYRTVLGRLARLEYVARIDPSYME